LGLSVTPFAAFQSLGILDNKKERLNRLVIGVATMQRIILEREDPDCLAQLICTGPGFAALSEHLVSGFVVKEMLGRLRQEAAGDA
jgi:hypothetical protein